MATRRTIFFISDSTAITVQILGQSLLTQFDHVKFEVITLPFINTIEKANDAVFRINRKAEETGLRPIVFSTLIQQEMRQAIRTSAAVVFDFIDTFLSPLEKELSAESSHAVGRYHGVMNGTLYNVRIDAVNYALDTDDGTSVKNYDTADVVLVGVSRTGKTPTCIYLGLQFGVNAANYPLTEEDFLSKDKKINLVLSPFKDKLFGLTINPERLEQIRSERRPNSRYATLSQCQMEVALAESLFISEHIPFLNITSMSIEEIAATVMHEKKLQRRLF